MRDKIRKLLCLCLITAMIGSILTESDYAIFAHAEETTENMAPKAEDENNQAAVSDSQTTDAPSVVEVLQRQLQVQMRQLLKEIRVQIPKVQKRMQRAAQQQAVLL